MKEDLDDSWGAVWKSAWRHFSKTTWKDIYGWIFCHLFAISFFSTISKDLEQNEGTSEEPLSLSVLTDPEFKPNRQQISVSVTLNLKMSADQRDFSWKSFPQCDVSNRNRSFPSWFTTRLSNGVWIRCGQMVSYVTSNRFPHSRTCRSVLWWNHVTERVCSSLGIKWKRF